jgi:hypothetical protein
MEYLILMFQEALIIFIDNLDIQSARSPEKEVLVFEYSKCNTRMINPRSTNNNVEVWLDLTEDIMKKSIAAAIDNAIADFPNQKRAMWVSKWQSQTVLSCNQIFIRKIWKK